MILFQNINLYEVTGVFYFYSQKELRCLLPQSFLFINEKVRIQRQNNFPNKVQIHKCEVKSSFLFSLIVFLTITSLQLNFNTVPNVFFQEFAFVRNTLLMYTKENLQFNGLKCICTFLQLLLLIRYVLKSLSFSVISLCGHKGLMV